MPRSRRARRAARPRAWSVSVSARGAGSRPSSASDLPRCCCDRAVDGVGDLVLVREHRAVDVDREVADRGGGRRPGCRRWPRLMLTPPMPARRSAARPCRRRCCPRLLLRRRQLRALQVDLLLPLPLGAGGDKVHLAQEAGRDLAPSIRRAWSCSSSTALSSSTLTERPPPLRPPVPLPPPPRGAKLGRPARPDVPMPAEMKDCERTLAAAPATSPESGSRKATAPLAMLAALWMSA